MSAVVVLLRRGPSHQRTAQGLRAAVGYITAGLQVTVVLCGPAQALLPLPPPALRRPIDTLRALGHQILPGADDATLLALVREARAVVAW